MQKVNKTFGNVQRCKHIERTMLLCGSATASG